MISFDGQTYDKQEDVPDLGSLKCVKVDGNRRFYVGLTQDAYKLPKYSNLGTGSRFQAVDSNLSKIYESTTKTWYTKDNSGGETDYAEVEGDLIPLNKNDYDSFFDKEDSDDKLEDVDFGDFFGKGV